MVERSITVKKKESKLQICCDCKSLAWEARDRLTTSQGSYVIGLESIFGLLLCWKLTMTDQASEISGPVAAILVVWLMSLLVAEVVYQNSIYIYSLALVCLFSLSKCARLILVVLKV